MTVSFTPAKREAISLLIGLAGGTGSGKTFSAMRIATGLSGGARFAVVDTENGRAKHYADDFAFDHAGLEAPFRPERYAEAIEAADAAGYPVIVVDSMSHEWDGDGGCLDWQEEEFQRMGGRDAVKMASWIAPKRGHRKMLTRLLQVKAHVILCFRAAERIEMVKVNGKTEVRPKQSLVALDGWLPITEPRLPFELTLSLLCMADNPGVPKPVKLPEKLRELVFTDVPLDEATGERLATWAKGSGASPSPRVGDDTSPVGAPDALTDEQRDRLDELVAACRLSGDKLYATAAKDRGETKAALVERYGGEWPALRESLTEAEAASWIERLEKVPAGAAA